MKIKIVNNQKMLNQALKVREIVFIDEQKVPLSEEIDEYETTATHFLVYNKKNQPIATCRTRVYHDNKIKIERVCVLKPYRDLKIGQKLMNFAELEAKKQGFTTAILAAQTPALNFYQRLGYQICSESFIDANIEHYLMEKLL
ncbi:MAG: GNAT family N-acetyltransferase [Spiroplasma sp.]|nr:GNAT family N-acetyltransferase [Spiroplasma sp.]